MLVLQVGLVMIQSQHARFQVGLLTLQSLHIVAFGF
jgi:hypothetical protein